MRGLGGFVLLAGIGVGLFVYFPAPVDGDTTLEQAKSATAARVVTSKPRSTPAPASASTRVASFSPTVTLAPARGKTRVAAAQPAPVAPALTPAAKVEPIANWQTNVMPAAGPSGSLEPTDPESRYKLVVDIQQQLKRVGCYWGRANGAWNNSTREAMRTFTANTNAALPVEKPDYLLLSLLKQNNGRSCGITETTTIAAQPQKPNAVAAAQPEVLPWKANAAQPATRLYTPLPNSVVSTEPLPGRMAIGAPKDFPPATQQPLIPGTTPTQPGVATAALEPGAAGPAAVSPPSAATPRAPRQGRKSSGSFRRPNPGTPRYNLMLSLGGVY
jgi:hypothetical protein